MAHQDVQRDVTGWCRTAVPMLCRGALWRGDPLREETPKVSARVSPKFHIADNDKEVFCVRFSPDGQYLAA